jgi:hypothetical protein
MWDDQYEIHGDPSLDDVDEEGFLVLRKYLSPKARLAKSRRS